MERITKEELLEMLFHDDYEHLKGKKLRMTRVRVPGKEVCLAHVISPSQSCIYENLGLHIGVHEGEDHTGESIGLIRFTPWEAVVVAADVAMKSADVQIGFMDRFCGSLFLNIWNSIQSTGYGIFSREVWHADHNQSVSKRIKTARQ